ncbi:hypothetical protein IU510_30235 [Nocardia cyriacigeorgica]|uniref:glycosyltransferase n=1 Tax=Nocardia cyriacigeorgica TaxID=135487 RepID=UPI0018953BED|nr:hypothetical protein [Nocardia cyriacigeorgica]MBF6102301.1 hypothetical protein [Nocardia cyriacigeorgica]
MTTTVLVAYAPGLGHCNTILPLAEEFARRDNCTVHLCGSRAVAQRAGIHTLRVTHHRTGPEGFLRTSADGLRDHEVVAEMGRLSRRDVTNLIHEIQPDLLVCDTSERGAVLAALDCDVPVLRVVSCADAATTSGSLEEARRRALIRGYAHDDLGSPLNLGTVALGPRWFFRDRAPAEDLTCYRYRPPTTAPLPFVAPIRPRAVISFGTFVTEPTPVMFESIFAGLADAGIRSIACKIRDSATRSRVQQHTELVSARTECDITVTEELNPRQYLLHADILLCHGSATSTLEALYHRVTPIIAPTHNDTYFVARQCARVHAAVVIHWGSDFSSAAIRRATTAAMQTREVQVGVAQFRYDNDNLPSAGNLIDRLIGRDRAVAQSGQGGV